MGRENKILQGFTIIELMVVITVISVLATIAASAVLNYMKKAKDLAVKSDVAQVKKILQMYYADHGTYELSEDIKSQYEQTGLLIKTNSSSSFVVYSKLPSNSKYWCNDSTGKETELSSPPVEYECDDGIYYCSPTCEIGYTCTPGNNGGGNACVQDAGTSEEDNSVCNPRLGKSECESNPLCTFVYGGNGNVLKDGADRYYCSGTCSGCEIKYGPDDWHCHADPYSCCEHYQGCSWSGTSCENKLCSDAVIDVYPGWCWSSFCPSNACIVGECIEK